LRHLITNISKYITNISASRRVEAIDVQCWWPSDDLSADWWYDVMPSREAKEGYF